MKHLDDGGVEFENEAEHLAWQFLDDLLDGMQEDSHVLRLAKLFNYFASSQNSKYE